jgi:outer membrane protein
MKKVLLTAVAVFSLTFVNAQEKEAKAFGFAQGNMFLEGNLSFSSSTTTDSFQGTDIEEDKNSSFNFNPKFGYFISDKLALGAELSVGSSKNENTDFTTSPNVVSETTGSSFGAGVFARYYFLDLGERFKTFTEVGLAFGSETNEFNGTETSSANGFGLGVDLGMNYFVTENMAISFGLSNVLSYGTATAETPAGDETQVSGLSGNFNVFNNFFDTPTFGLLYKF